MTKMTQYEMIKSLLDEKMINVHEKLDSIYEQTKKTNGRVTVVEGKVTDLEKANLTHTTQCPYGPKITKLEEEAVKNRATKTFVVKTVGIVSALFGIAWILFKMFIEGGN